MVPSRDAESRRCRLCAPLHPGEPDAAFAHFLLTRFNVKVGFGHWSPPSADWLAHRFDLFERFTYPSVRAQTCSNFTWLVFFDSATPSAFTRRVEELARSRSFIPCYVDEFGGPDTFLSRRAHERLQALIERHRSRASRYLITTRLDNDDAISADFVEALHQNFVAEAFEFLEFPRGYKLRGDRLYASRQLVNPFISLVERIGDPAKTVWCEKQQALAGLGRIRSIDGSPYWLQVVHERNALNVVHDGDVRIRRRMLDERFPVREPAGGSRESELGIKLENLARRVARRLRAVRRRVRRVLGNISRAWR